MIPGARLIILGRQGAGKGTQCVRLSRHFVVPHISTGDMLRAAVREGTELGEGCKVGNFVETKKAQLGDGAKASHLSYLGDVKVGARANVGAGTITCNYDGYSKHKTEIGEGAFIGSDTQLVAPVKVGAGAFVGAGSTVTKDVSAGALALSRPEQSERAGWADRFHAKQRERR